MTSRARPAFLRRLARLSAREWLDLAIPLLTEDELSAFVQMSNADRDAFMAEFPTPEAMAAAGPGAVITAWGRLGYPRRARRLWESAEMIARAGWPADLTELPGIGRYTAAAIAAQVDDDDRVGIEVNVRRVCERVRGTRLTDPEAEECVRELRVCRRAQRIQLDGATSFRQGLGRSIHPDVQLNEKLVIARRPRLERDRSVQLCLGRGELVVVPFHGAQRGVPVGQ